MNQALVTDELAAIFKDVFDDPALVLQRDMTADDVEGWDSVRMIELIVAAEAKFSVRFTTRETDGLTCVGDFIDLITRKTGG